MITSKDIATPSWRHCKHILCIRPDNIGDILMSEPAIRALKNYLGCKITVLTSTAAARITSLMAVIDDVIPFDVPWAKHDYPTGADAFQEMVSTLASRHFDGAVIFTVYSQNPMPAIMLAYLADIPLRLAYCRENPYDLLTHWIPEKEPYTFIRHQVRRDLDLVGEIGASIDDEHLRLSLNAAAGRNAVRLMKEHLQPSSYRHWILVHTGVSEYRRAYPVNDWIAIGKFLVEELSCQLLFTGTTAESKQIDAICNGIGPGAVSLAGCCDLTQLTMLIRLSPLLLSVNTGMVHIAAATGTPVVVLYAMTNPQHTPWMVPNEVLYFPVKKGQESNNEVVRYGMRIMEDTSGTPVSMSNIASAIARLLGITLPVEKDGNIRSSSDEMFCSH
ncbi:glycosyltransferase family 9 protein [Chitinophaga pendula]|uniref:glycosyltransferase family 9 protein n=1 Tax=Chitinophaga TaxID=79328 RepID=UPI000BAFBF75|nr:MULTISPECIES: glycosyltransferase family 9 protein [Chitinophaga]ASZ13824.1 glycosyl transferase [Chitinophaga sp. MD30]UCJ08554.1 glycosyltransferase family 9 protein [Chitinophaga pendula]